MTWVCVSSRRPDGENTSSQWYTSMARPRYQTAWDNECRAGSDKTAERKIGWWSAMVECKMPRLTYVVLDGKILEKCAMQLVFESLLILLLLPEVRPQPEEKQYTVAFCRQSWGTSKDAAFFATRANVAVDSALPLSRCGNLPHDDRQTQHMLRAMHRAPCSPYVWRSAPRRLSRVCVLP